ncbi:MAG: efflux RND transporter permease subunit [Candidatus Nanoarchaeia archaeon]
MIKTIQKSLKKLVEFEIKHYALFIVILLFFSGIAFVGFTKLRFESDFSKFSPKGIDVVELQEKINTQFSDFSSILVIVELDDSLSLGEQITDIRDPKVIKFLVELTNNLKEESKIESVSSVGLIFSQGVPEDIEVIKSILRQVPESGGFFDDSYTLTPVIIKADVGNDAEKVKELNSKIRDIIQSSSRPGGIKVTITGEPALGSKLFDLMIHDGIYTLIIAVLVIYLLLLFLKRSFKHALVILLPVLIGVLWTIGSMGLFDIPVSVATVAIGSMLLGLGIEYSIFLHSRYVEERRIHNVNNSIIIAVSTTGASTLSSGVTTLIGFFALTTSIFPMLADLGFVLGLGIGLILLSVLVFGPLIIIIEEKLSKKHQIKESNLETRAIRYFGKYASFVSKHPVTIILISLIISLILFGGISRINSEEIDFNTVLPDDMEELVAFEKMENAFGDSETFLVYIELEPSYSDSDEPEDIRDPRIINYADVLSQQLLYLDYAQGVQSISFREKEKNKIIPSTLFEQKKLLANIQHRDLINEDYSAMLIKLQLSKDVEKDLDEAIRQFYEVIDNTKKPSGVKVYAAGNSITDYELNNIIGPDSSKSAMLTFVLIIVFLLLISRSVKYTILPLVTVVFALVWIMGLIGYFGIPFNSIISSVLSMTIGIGIDFGIQLSMRFRQELVNNDKRTAMKNTIQNTLYPMVITVIAALVGFRAMSAGDLTLMADLGNTMSIAIMASMFVAITVVAGLMLVFQRDKKADREELNALVKNKSIKKIKISKKTKKA